MMIIIPREVGLEPNKTAHFQDKCDVTVQEPAYLSGAAGDHVGMAGMFTPAFGSESPPWSQVIGAQWMTDLRPVFTREKHDVVVNASMTRVRCVVIFLGGQRKPPSSTNPGHQR